MKYLVSDGIFLGGPLLLASDLWTWKLTVSLSVNFGFETIFSLGFQKNIDAENISSAVRILGRWEGAEVTWAAIPSDLEAWTCYPRTCESVDE